MIASWAVGLVLLGAVFFFYGIFVVVVQRVQVGLRGMSRHLHGTGARLMGFFHVAIGVIMIGGYFLTDSGTAAAIMLGSVVGFLVVNLLVYFVLESEA